MIINAQGIIKHILSILILAAHQALALGGLKKHSGLFQNSPSMISEFLAIRIEGYVAQLMIDGPKFSEMLPAFW